MKEKKTTVLAVMLLGLLLLWGSLAGLQRDKLLQPLAEKVLRLRILADSDLPSAQRDKLAVRDALLRLLGRELPGDASRAQILAYLEDHDDRITAVIRETLPKEVSASHTLGEAYFPRKTYGSLTLPAGNYEALVIRIGSARGANWWCCLYPQLCFQDAVTVSVSEDSERQLKSLLTEEETSWLTREYEPRFLLGEWLANWFR